MLLHIFHDAYREDLELNYSVGQRDFRKICDDFLMHATERCVTATRGPRDMEVDALSQQTAAQKHPTEEWAAYADGLESRLEEVNYMGQKGQ